jgi:nucleotide-binding universal stress UspA family protein
MTILVGYKRTPEGKAALDHGLEAASSTGAPLAIFPLMEKDEAAADPREDSALNAAIEAGATLLKSTPGGGHPAEELLDTAAENDAALIVIGVRNRSRVSKLLLGSDAQSIILGATAPVLTVKAASHER